MIWIKGQRRWIVIDAVYSIKKSKHSPLMEPTFRSHPFAHPLILPYPNTEKYIFVLTDVVFLATKCINCSNRLVFCFLFFVFFKSFNGLHTFTLWWIKQAKDYTLWLLTCHWLHQNISPLNTSNKILKICMQNKTCLFHFKNFPT
jgi:hypothetical protein